MRLRAASLAFAILLLVLLPLRATPTALAASPSDVTAALRQGDVYISPDAISHGVASTSDRSRLQAVVDRAARSGVDEKIAIVSSYPSKYDSAQAATVALRDKLGFDGVLVAVYPQAIGISSSILTRRDIELIDRHATNSSQCDANKPVGCAVLAGSAAIPAYLDELAIIKVAGTLKGQNVLITPGAISARVATAADSARLDVEVRKAAGKGVTEKFLAVGKYPEGYSNPTDAAGALANRIGLSGVLVLLAPDGIGIGSDLLGSGDRNKIEAQAGSCAPAALVRCAVATGDAAIPVYKDAKAHQDLINTIILIVFLVIILACVALFILYLRHRAKQKRQRLDDLRTAAGNTLEVADRAIEAIEAKNPLPAGTAKKYNGAIALRERARNEMEKAKTAEQLTQANQDAAQAALSFQGVLKELKLPLGPDDPLEEGLAHRCFYCARTDRPPYTEKTISDGKGNSMIVDVCADDAKKLAEGQTPKVATVQSGNRSIPWWAVSTDPYYYRYGGVGWQYWLPVTTGVNVNQWYSGASSGSYSQPKSAQQTWGGGGDTDTRSDVAEGHLSGTSSWGGGGNSGGDW